MLINAPGDILIVASLHEHGDTAGHLHILDSAAQFTLAFVKGLAAFFRTGSSQHVHVFLQQVLEFKQILDAVGRGHTTPFLKR